MPRIVNCRRISHRNGAPVGYINQRHLQAYFAAQTNGLGRRFRVHRARAPIDRHTIGQHSPYTYANSLLLNDRVYVPITGTAADVDREALELCQRVHTRPHARPRARPHARKRYQRVLPRHTVIGVVADPGAKWLASDALHCRTRAVPFSRYFLKKLRAEHADGQRRGPVPI